MKEMDGVQRLTFVAGVIEGLAIARYMKDGKQKTGMECIDAGDITQKELETMKKDLAADMPDAVREKFGIEQPKADVAPAQNLAAAAPKTAMPANMDDLMRQTGLGAGPAGP